ncbi:RNA recognition motif domain-containing protein [Planctobacterium marinum]|uniref:RNA recognition motif domain-containing protein n=1 Tax=Planctobacterium marinum TaxID=1631968 RepID=UPI001E539DC6|nr:RNA-binding protein [Planctobacterium marinum]MCC2607881.1 RNA-binding protein [Planctobacterium marinum]
MPFFLPSLAIGAIVGVAGYFLLDFGLLAINSPFAFLLGSIITALILSFMSGTSASNQDDSDADSEVATLYVGNLPYRVNEQTVKDYFDKVTNVNSVRLLRDRKTGKRKGFGFVEIPANDVDKVVKKLNDSEFEDRTLKVRIAKDRNDKEE